MTEASMCAGAGVGVFGERSSGGRMRAMTKSAVQLVREALTIGRAALPMDARRSSRHDFTQPQLFALLTLRQFLRTDYRGLVAWLAEWAELRRALGVRKVPHYSTLCYAERRLLATGPAIGSVRPCALPVSSGERTRRERERERERERALTVLTMECEKIVVCRCLCK